MRLEAVLFSFHVAVRPSEISRVGAIVFLLSCAGQRAPIYFLYTALEDANLQEISELAYCVEVEYWGILRRGGEERGLGLLWSLARELKPAFGGHTAALATP